MDETLLKLVYIRSKWHVKHYVVCILLLHIFYLLCQLLGVNGVGFNLDLTTSGVVTLLVGFVYFLSLENNWGRVWWTTQIQVSERRQFWLETVSGQVVRMGAKLGSPTLIALYNGNLEIENISLASTLLCIFSLICLIVSIATLENTNGVVDAFISFILGCLFKGFKLFGFLVVSVSKIRKLIQKVLQFLDGWAESDQTFRHHLNLWWNGGIPNVEAAVVDVVQPALNELGVIPLTE